MVPEGADCATQEPPACPGSVDGAPVRLDTRAMFPPLRHPHVPAPARASVLVPVLLAALLVGLVAADEGEDVAPTARLTIRGTEPLRGAFLGCDASGVRFQPAAGQVRVVAWDDLVELTTGSVGPVAARDETLWRARLAAGEVLLGRRVADPDHAETLRLDVAGLGTASIPLDALRFAEALPPDAPRTLDRSEMHPAEEGLDIVYDERDDRLAGTLLALGGDDVVVEDEGGRERRVPWSRARTLHVAAEDGANATPGGLVIEVDLGDGSRIATSVPPRLDGDTLTIRPRSLPDASWRIPRNAIVAMRARGGTFDYATFLPFTSELDTGTADHADVGVDAILARLWRARVDRRAAGNPLVVGGTTWRHGFAVHSTSRVRIALEGAWAMFETGIGIDDEVLALPAGGGGPASRGAIGARVLGDGRVLWEKDAIRGGEGVVWTGPLDVRGVRTLTLEVTRGPDGLSTRDRADWVRPLLVRAR